jgi:hypothetical protein
VVFLALVPKPNNLWLGLKFFRSKPNSTQIHRLDPWLFGFEAEASERHGLGFGLASHF